MLDFLSIQGKGVSFKPHTLDLASTRRWAVRELLGNQGVGALQELFDLVLSYTA